MSDPSDNRTVSSAIDFSLRTPAVIAFQIAASKTAGPIVAETLDVEVDGAPSGVIVEEIESHRSGRTHVVRAGPGTLRVRYDAIVGPASISVDRHDDTAYDDEVIVALRQSRYCPSDELAGFASNEFSDHLDRPDLAAVIGSWVFERFAYAPGTSGPFDTAADTLVRHEGVCRDFAHVTIALCRALGVPARLVAAYAPGLSPMDFHAVAEVCVAGSWEIVDSTRLAPRPALVRIATGRDAADTAFATTLEGEAELVSLEISAVTDGDLPADDHAGHVVIG